MTEVYRPTDWNLMRRMDPQQAGPRPGGGFRGRGANLVDYGSYKFVRALQGSFGIIDEIDDTHGPEASTTGICLVPSTEALCWIMRKIGFSRVEVLPVPADGYEQLLHGKRVMVAGYVD